MALIIGNGGASKTIKYSVYDSLSDSNVHNNYTAFEGDDLYDKTNIKVTVKLGSMTSVALMKLNTASNTLTQIAGLTTGDNSITPPTLSTNEMFVIQINSGTNVSSGRCMIVEVEIS